MPIQPTYPGVYIEEIPSGVRTITGVATSITAFVGSAARGQTDDEGPVTINSFADYERIFGGLWLKSTMSYAVKDFYLNGGGQAIIVRVAHGDVRGGHPDDEAATAATLTLDSSDSPTSHLELIAANVGDWGNNLQALVDYDTKEKDDSASHLFNLSVREIEPKTKNSGKQRVLNSEKFMNVSVNPTDSLYLPRVLEQRSALIRVKREDPDDPTSYLIPSSRPMETLDCSSPPKSPPAEVHTWKNFNHGHDGSAIRNEDLFSGTGLEDKKRGLYALDKADLFNLLCVPPYVTSAGEPPADGEQPTDVTPELIAAAAAYCEKRRAMLLVDPSSDWTKKEDAKKSFTDGPYPGLSDNRNYAALFFPRLKQPNPLHDNQIEEFVPCGAVAGIFARTDAQRGVWKAPAGQDAGLVGVPQLSVSLTDAENGELNQLGINCLRAFPVIGRIVWGARTLEGADRLASEWKYIPVRRTALFIEESLFRGTKWVVFEPNDEPLWAQIRLNVGAFMHNLFRQGAFQGKTPKEAYLVKCDSETTTQNDINQGVVNILVGFAPLKPAEFVFIKLQQMAGQIQA